MTLSFCGRPRWLAVIAVLGLTCGRCLGAAPPPQFLGIAVSGAQVNFSFSSQPGVQYDVQSSENVTGPWTLLLSVGGSGATVMVTDPSGGTHSQRYYRVRDEFNQYSVNTVGFANLSLTTNWNLVANQ